MRAKAALLAVAASAALIAPMPARAAVAVVAAPGATTAGYATPAVVWVKGTEPLRFVNADIIRHDVVSDETRAPGSAPWCPAGGPRCPLFYAPGAGVGGVEDIVGLEDAEPGVPYAFYCSPHENMVGTLVVVAA